MSVVIRLKRTGKRGIKEYRIVAMNKRDKRDGLPLDLLGNYTADKKNPKYTIDNKKLAAWREKGAQLTPAVYNLVKQQELA